MRRRLTTRSADETEALAGQIGRALRGGETLLLSGDLGAGKTCFVRGLARGLGIEDRLVKSPSYNILHRYAAGDRVVEHFDAYFVREEEEFPRAGLDEFLENGEIVVVEWADRFPDAFDPGALFVQFEFVGEESRSLELHTTNPELGSRIEAILTARDPDGATTDGRSKE